MDYDPDDDPVIAQLRRGNDMARALIVLMALYVAGLAWAAWKGVL